MNYTIRRLNDGLVADEMVKVEHKKDMIDKSPIAGIIMAAGMSTRLGRPKQLLKVGGKALTAWVVDACMASKLDRIVLVLGREAIRVQSALNIDPANPRMKIVINNRYREGMSTSLRTGMAAIEDDFPAVMFLLGDQPFLEPNVINFLLDRFRQSDKDICVPVHQGRRGNPTIFGRAWYDELMNLSGDLGARNIIRNHPDRVLAVEIDSPLCFLDIDREEDIRVLRESRPDLSIAWTDD